METEKKEKKEVVLPKISAVLYTDGSAKPNPGFGGWGIYGYLYDENKPVDPKNQKKNILTNDGYMDASEYKQKGVTAYRKVDTLEAFGTADKEVNNNHMELEALGKALTLIDKHAWENTTILSDSMIAINSMGQWYHNWVKNNWHNSKGEPVKMKDGVIRIKSIFDDVTSRRTVKMLHVKGHAGNFGNEKADRLANKGSTMSSFGKSYEEIKFMSTVSDIKVDTNLFFTKNRLYFIGGAKAKKDANLKYGWYWYYTGVMGKGKNDDDFGMHMADGFQSIVLLKEPEPVIEKVIKRYQQICNQDYAFVACLRLDTLLTPENYQMVEEDEIELFCHDKVEKTILLPNEKILVKEYNPAHLSFLRMSEYATFTEKVQGYLEEEEEDKYIVTDVTELFIDSSEKDKKGNTKPKLIKGVSSNNYLKTNVRYKVDGELKEFEIKLTTKVELPDKNHLAKLIRELGNDIRIKVVTYRMSEDSFGYFSVVESEKAIGIWHNVDTCIAIHRKSK